MKSKEGQDPVVEGPTEQLHVVVEGVEIQCEKATKEMGRGLWDSGNLVLGDRVQALNINSAVDWEHP